MSQLTFVQLPVFRMPERQDVPLTSNLQQRFGGPKLALAVPQRELHGGLLSWSQ
jgi:hypothetical protein